MLECVVGFALDAAKEGLELVALEWTGFVSLEILDEDSVFLCIGNAEFLVGDRCEERGSVGEICSLLKRGVPADTERYETTLAGHSKKAYASCYAERQFSDQTV